MSDYIKIKDFSPIKGTLNKIKKWVTAWEMLALSKTHGRLEMRQSCESPRKRWQSNGKMSEGYEAHEGNPKLNSHVSRHANLAVIRKAN